MFLISILKSENRRAGTGRKKANNTNSGAPELKTSNDRRTIDDRRNDAGRRTGLYYRLPEDHQDTVDTIIKILEKKLEK
jgi:hypothetical protein